ncbi:MAG TPA: tyrosinase family protein [Cryptosporangiaceae bacterium]|nr:tyrosinase family protein [Cryptosporangiaceae bacterium]
MALRIRKNLSTLTAAEKQRFVAAVLELKRRGTYDKYVHDHMHAMDRVHGRSSFLPWHREYIRRFEMDLRAIDSTVTLPYWDWTVDNSATASIWNVDLMGGNGRAGDQKVMDGPFAFDSGRWTCVGPPNFLQRALGTVVSALPTPAHVTTCLGVTPYDNPPWDGSSNPSFRNHLEGFVGPGLHNQVHRWVGGHMRTMMSPDDPVFFLHHCNVDRLWAQWQRQRPAEPYVPASGGPSGQNLNDEMQPWGWGTTIASRLDHRKLGYTYDTELVLWPVPTSPVAQGDDMQAGEVLNPDQSITSANGRYRFTYQGDGNLVLYGPAGALWASRTAGKGVGACVMQADGNLVIYDHTVWPVWATGTNNNPGSRLVVQDDANTVIYNAKSAAVWNTNTWLPSGPTAQGNDMLAGEVLPPGQSIRSANGRYRLTYQTDGNLVLYGPSGALWSSRTAGQPAGMCIMQTDGNLALYRPGGQRTWASGTGNNPGSRVVCQDDGNTVIYNAKSAAVWATNTRQV